MSSPILIGLTGKRGSGKSTVGGYIKDWAQENGEKAQLQGFADRLKLSFARIFVPDATLEEALGFCDTIKNIGSIKHDTIFPEDRHDLFHRFGVKNVVSGREALQHYGTEAHRDIFGTDFWVDQLLLPRSANSESGPAWLSNWDSDIDYAIVTDLRFPNEADRILELGGIVYEIRRGELEDQEDTHASEQKLDDAYFYGVFQNNGSLEELKAEVFKELDNLHEDFNSEYYDFQKSQLGEAAYHGH